MQQLIVHLFGERLGEQIREILRGRHVPHLDLSSRYELTQVQVATLDVSRTYRAASVFRQCHGAHVVHVQDRGLGLRKPYPAKTVKKKQWQRIGANDVCVGYSF